MKKYYIFWTILLFMGCQKQDMTFEKLNDSEDLNTYRVYFKGERKIQISFDSLGNISSIYNQVPGGVQSLHYFPNGMIGLKSFMDNDLRTQGRAYYFFEQSGHLASLRQYVNDTLDGYQFDTYDREGTDSMVQHYIKGCCVGRLVFDKKEEAISVSGSFIAK